MSADRIRAVLPHLPLLVALDEQGSVTAAAEAVGMPQPAASRALRRLGDRLGTPVTEPNGRGIRLTPSARALVPFARAALRAVDDGMSAWDAAEDDAAWTVGVAFQNSLGEHLVPAMVREVRASGLPVRFDLRQGARDLCLALLAEGHADIAIVSDDASVAQGFVTDALYAQRLVALVPRDSALAGSARLRASELQGEPFVTMRHGFGLRRSITAIFADSGCEPDIAYEAEDIHTVVGLVDAGLGVAIVPDEPGRPEGCVSIRLDDELAVRRMVAVHRGETGSPAVRAVRGALARLSG